MSNEQKMNTVQQWRAALQEAARTAVEALAFETPINKAAPSLDESSKILGAAIYKIRQRVRPEPKTVAFWEEEAWYRMKDAAKPAGEYRTPKDAIDFVTANPPLDIPPAAEPLAPDAPKMAQGEKPWKQANLASIPELGINFNQHYTKDYYKAVCWWHNDETREGHVYELTVKKWASGATSDGVATWRALAQTDGKVLFSLESKSKGGAIECALAAFRRYLIRGHRAAWRTYRKALAAAKDEAR